MAGALGTRPLNAASSFDLESMEPSAIHTSRVVRGFSSTFPIWLRNAADLSPPQRILSSTTYVSMCQFLFHFSTLLGSGLAPNLT